MELFGECLKHTTFVMFICLFANCETKSAKFFCFPFFVWSFKKCFGFIWNTNEEQITWKIWCFWNWKTMKICRIKRFFVAFALYKSKLCFFVCIRLQKLKTKIQNDIGLRAIKMYKQIQYYFRVCTKIFGAIHFECAIYSWTVALQMVVWLLPNESWFIFFANIIETFMNIGVSAHLNVVAPTTMVLSILFKMLGTANELRIALGRCTTSLASLNNLKWVYYFNIFSSVSNILMCGVNGSDAVTNIRCLEEYFCGHLEPVHT